MNWDVSLGKLDRASARLCLNVERNALELGIKPGAHLVLAVSGGADSLAMTVIFAILAKRQNFQLSAMHVDHCLRPESAEDARFTRDFCGHLNIPAAIARVDVGAMAASQGMGLEEAGRIARHARLHEFRKASGADFILLAHHRLDLCEDILLRLSRGAGWPALGGMKAIRGHIARPLLGEDPLELRHLLSSQGFCWREDASNQSLAFKRNRMRHNLLPLLAEENPAFPDVCLHINLLAAIDDDYWEKMFAGLLANNPWLEKAQPPEIILPEKLLKNLHKAERLRLYHRAIRRLRELDKQGKMGQARAVTLFRLDESYAKGRHAGRFQFPGGYEAIITGRDIHFKSCHGLTPSGVRDG